MSVSKNTYTIQVNGQVTLPVDFHKKYGLKKEDIVVFMETDDSLLISMRESLVSVLHRTKHILSPPNPFKHRLFSDHSHSLEKRGTNSSSGNRGAKY